MKLDRRKIAAGALIVAGITAFIIPFLFQPAVRPVSPPPPPGGGGGKGPCTTNCGDKTIPQTTLQISNNGISWIRNSITYYFPNITVTLHATDEGSLSSIILSDNGTITTFNAEGKAATASLTIHTNGVHELAYYSTDQAGNKETAHNAMAGVDKPNTSDLQNAVDSSGVDSAGITNALTVKIDHAQAKIDAGQTPNNLNALSNQLNALDGKHGLGEQTVALLQAMIHAMLG